MAWYEYTTWKRQGAEIAADIQGWLTRRRARRDAAVKAVMQAEIQRAEERFAKYMERAIRLLEMTDERQNFRLTVIEKKLGIPTGPSEAILLLEHNGVQGLNELSWPTRLLDEKGCRKSTLHLLARIT